MMSTSAGNVLSSANPFSTRNGKPQGRHAEEFVQQRSRRHGRWLTNLDEYVIGQERLEEDPLCCRP